MEMSQIIKSESEFIFEKMRENIGNPSYQYWQGRLDSLSWVLKNLPSEG
jgi:hypothetical protein